MASLTPVIVHVEKPDGTLFSKYFGEMRIWLDAHKMAPVDFRLLGGYSVGFDIGFSSPEDANRFEREFGSEAPLTTVVPLSLGDCLFGLFLDHDSVD